MSSSPETALPKPAEGSATAPQVASNGNGGAAAAATADDSSDDDVVVEKSRPENLTLWQKTQKHLRRYWYWYLLGGFIFLVILFPILFKVIIPAIVQLVVRQQSLPVNTGALRTISSSMLSLSLNTTLYVPLPVWIDPFQLELYNADTPDYSPFVTLTPPNTFVGRSADLIIADQVVPVQNKTELIKWFDEIYLQETVQVSARGVPGVHLGTLVNYPTLDHTVSFPGLNNLKGASVGDLQLILPADSDGNNLKGTIMLPNASPLTLNLGDLTLNLMSGNLNLGYVNLPNVTLERYANITSTFSGRLYLEQLGTNIGPLLTSQSDALSRGVVELNATGNATRVNGEHIDYLEAVLGTKKLTLDISVIKLLSSVLNGLLHGGTTSIVDALSDVLGNNTFVGQLVDNFNTTKIMGNSSNVAREVLQRRAIDRNSMAWTMLKLGMRAHMGKSL